MIFLRAITRTKGRFVRLYKSLSDEYARTSRYFEMYGCSLHCRDIFRRGCMTGFVMTFIIAAVTIPLILYHHGVSNPKLYTNFLFELAFCYWLCFLLVWIAHLLWAFAFVAGSKIGGSRYFWGFIEKRWGAQIDKITDELMAESREEGIEDDKADENGDNKETPKVEATEETINNNEETDLQSPAPVDNSDDLKSNCTPSD